MKAPRHVKTWTATSTIDTVWVFGILWLRHDASLFPAVPCANTNFPTLMTAERIADATLAAA